MNAMEYRRKLFANPLFVSIKRRVEEIEEEKDKSEMFLRSLLHFDEEQVWVHFFYMPGHYLRKNPENTYDDILPEVKDFAILGHLSFVEDYIETFLIGSSEKSFLKMESEQELAETLNDEGIADFTITCCSILEWKMSLEDWDYKDGDQIMKIDYNKLVEDL